MIHVLGAVSITYLDVQRENQAFYLMEYKVARSHSHSYIKQQELHMCYVLPKHLNSTWNS